ncbi:holin [Neobacillus rhizosphaerae]|uniref:holin n=1 Tax=Neobacillus rhizosphaerae TaxID=2880965 RepID=UPI003D2CD741
MIEFGIIIAVLVGLGQVAKQLGLSNKYIPLMNLIFGVGAGLTMIGNGDIPTKVITGMMIGLSASGLYDQTKLLTKK